LIPPSELHREDGVKFRPAGGDFQGMRAIVRWCISGRRKHRTARNPHRFDEPVRLSLGTVASPQSLPPFGLTGIHIGNEERKERVFQEGSA
jgi:hypothetical protein